MHGRNYLINLSGLCRQVVVSKIATDKAPEVNMIEIIGPTQQRAFKLLNIKPA